MEADPYDLLADTAAALDESIARLQTLALELEEKIGAERVEVVKGLLTRSYDRDDEAEIRLSLSYSERKLLWVWSRLNGLKDLRIRIGRGSMKSTN